MRKIVKSLLALSILGVTGGTAAAGAVIFNSSLNQHIEVVAAETPTYSGGAGEATNPYRISNATDLSNLAIFASGNDTKGKYYELTADIDLSGGGLWTPIGKESQPFKGTFWGNGYEISGNIILETSTFDTNYGLFGVIENAQIYDLTLAESFSYTTISGASCGSLIGKAINSIIAAVRDNSTMDKTIGTATASSIYLTGNSGVKGVTATGNVVTFDAREEGYPNGITGRRFVEVQSSTNGTLKLDGGTYYYTIDETNSKIYMYREENKTTNIVTALNISSNGSSSLEGNFYMGSSTDLTQPGRVQYWFSYNKSNSKLEISHGLFKNHSASEWQTKYYVAVGTDNNAVSLTNAPMNFGMVYPNSTSNTVFAKREGYVLTSGMQWIDSGNYGHTDFNLSSVNYNLFANWDQVRYTFNIYDKVGETTSETKSDTREVPMYMPWATLINGGKITINGTEKTLVSLNKTGYDLVKLAIGDIVYCSRTVTYDEAGNQTASAWTYSEGEQINLGNNHGTFNLVATWQPTNLNGSITYADVSDYTTKLDPESIRKGISNEKISLGEDSSTVYSSGQYINGVYSWAYTNSKLTLTNKDNSSDKITSSGEKGTIKIGNYSYGYSYNSSANTLTLSTSLIIDAGSKSLDFTIYGTATLIYSFTKNPGYNVTSVDLVDNSKTVLKSFSTFTSSGSTYSCEIDLTSLTENEMENLNLVVNIKRIQQTITITATNATVGLSNQNVKYTTYTSASGKLTTYAGEKFTLIFKPEAGYGISSVNYTNCQGVNISSTGDSGNYNSYQMSTQNWIYSSETPTITVTVKERTITVSSISITGPTDYPSPDNNKQPTFQIKNSRGNSKTTTGNLFLGTGTFTLEVINENNKLWKITTMQYSINGGTTEAFTSGKEILLTENDEVAITITYTKNTFELTFDKNNENATWDSGLPYPVYVVPVSTAYQYEYADGRTSYAFNAGRQSDRAQLIPKRTGYTFTGYALNDGTKILNYNASAGTKWGFVTGKTWSLITGDTTLYAVWKVNKYTVTFDPNGGSVSPTTKIVTYDSTYGTLPTPTRTGYTFNGWYTAASEGTKVTDSTKVTRAENHTLYANWEANILTIQYHLNANWDERSKKYTDIEVSSDGSFSNSDLENGVSRTDKFSYGSEYEFGLCNANESRIIRRGFRIAGTKYYTDSDCKQKSIEQDGVTATVDIAKALGVLSDLEKQDKTIVVYVKWEPKNYTLSYNSNGGSLASESYPTSFTYSLSNQTVEIPTPTRTGYTFAGWTITKSSGETISTLTTTNGVTESHKWSNNGLNLSISNGKLTIPRSYVGAITLTAKWGRKTYTIKYNKNSGSIGTTPATTTIEYEGELVSGLTVIRTGYKFAGWAINKNYDNKNYVYIFGLSNGVTEDSFKAKVNGSDATIKKLTGTKFSTDIFGTTECEKALFNDSEINIYPLWILDDKVILKYTDITGVTAIDNVEGKYPAWMPENKKINETLNYKVTSYYGDEVTFKVTPYLNDTPFSDGLTTLSFTTTHELKRNPSSGTLIKELTIESTESNVVLPFKDETRTASINYNTQFVLNIYEKNEQGHINSGANYEALANAAANYYIERATEANYASEENIIKKGLIALQDLMNRNETIKTNVKDIYGTIPDDITSLTGENAKKILSTSMNVISANLNIWMTNIPDITIDSVGYFNGDTFVPFASGEVGTHDSWFKLSGDAATLFEGVDLTYTKEVGGVYYIRNNATIYGENYNTQIEAPQTTINLGTAVLIYEGSKVYSYKVLQNGVTYTISTVNEVGEGTYNQPNIRITEVDGVTADNVNNFYYITGSLNIVNLGTLKEQRLNLGFISATGDHEIAISYENHGSISITSITYNNTLYTSFRIDANNVVWVQEEGRTSETPIGMIIGNGGLSPTVKFIERVSKFEYTVTGKGDFSDNNCKILEFTSVVGIDEIKTALQNADNLKALTQAVETSTGSSEYNIYLTRTAAVTVTTTFDNWNKEGTTTFTKTIYINTNESNINIESYLSEFSRPGYDLAGVKKVENVMDVAEDGFTINFNEVNATRVKPITLEAVWTPKSTPTITLDLTTKKPEFIADEENKTEFIASEFIESVEGFKSNEYTCTWESNGSNVLSLLNSDDAGAYTINIKLNNYDDVTYAAEVNFTCILQEVSITSVRNSANNSLVDSSYNGTNKIDGYNVLLSNNLVKTGSDDFFVLKWTKDSSEITEAINVGTYTLTVTLTEEGKQVYTFGKNAEEVEITELTFSFTITAKELTLSNISKVYDGTTNFDSSMAMATLGGVVEGETITVKGTFESKDASTANKVSGFIIEGATKDNYTIAASYDKASITAKALELSNISKAYDGETTFDSRDASNVVTISGLISGEDSYIYITGTFANIGPGESIGISGLSIKSSDDTYPASNYSLSSTPSTGEITKTSADGISATINDKVYGSVKSETDLAINDFNFTGGNSARLKDAEITSITISDMNLSTSGYLKVGEYRVDITISSTTVKDFTLSGLILRITQKALTITYVDTKIYDGTTSVASTKVGDVVGDVVGTTLTYSNKDIGENITISKKSGVDDANYKFIYKVGETTITELKGTITAYNYTLEDVNISKFFNQTDPTLSVDKETVNNEKLTFTFAREAGDNLGSYDLTIKNVTVKESEAISNDYTVSATEDGANLSYTFGNYVITIQKDNNWFVINARSSSILIYADTTGFNMTYNRENASLSKEFNENKWYLKVTRGTEVVSIPLLLKYYDETEAAEINRYKEITEGVDSLLSNVNFTVEEIEGIRVAKSYAISVSGHSTQFTGEAQFINSNNESIANITFEMNKKDISISVSKTYDGTTDFDSLKATLGGVIGGDIVTISGTYPDANVGNDKIIVDYTLSGADSGNYNVTSVTGSITAKDITIVISKEYDGNKNFTNANARITGLIDGDIDKVTISGTYPDANVGNGKIIVNYTLDGEDSGNYNVTSVTGSITAKDITIVISKEYDGNNEFTNSDAQFTGVIDGDIVTISGTYSNKIVGNNKVITYTLDGEDSGNYNVTSVTGSITAKDITIVISKEYDENNEFTNSDAQFTGVIDGDIVTISGTYSNKIVGNYEAITNYTLDGADSGNYNVTSVTGSITAKDITIVISKEYDGNNGFTTDNAEITGVIDGDIDKVTISGTYSDESVGNDKGITYTLDGEASRNYNVTSITGKILKISDTTGFGIKSVSYEYRGLTKAVDGRLETTLNGITFIFMKNDSKTDLVKNITFEILSSNISDESYSKANCLNAGTYSIRLKIKSETIEDFEADLTIAITKLDITIDLYKGATKLTTLSKVFDETDALPTDVVAKANFNGDEVAVTAKFEDATVGENKNIVYTITGADKENYNFAFSITKGTIGSYVFTKITLDHSKNSFVEDGIGIPSTLEINKTYAFNDGFNASDFISFVETEVKDVTRVGYTRENVLYLDANLNAEITTDNIASILKDYAGLDISELTFYTKWNRNSHILTLDGISKGLVNYYEDLRDLLTEPTREGYMFKGWFAGEIQYTSESKMPDSDLVLTSKWEANTYVVTANVNGGIFNEENLNGWTLAEDKNSATKNIKYDETYLQLPTVSRIGYIFKGWFVEGTKISDTTVVSLASNHNIEAEWQAITYTIVLDVDGGNFDADPNGWIKNSQEKYERKVSYDEEVELPVPNRKEYDFNGWKYNESVLSGNVSNLTGINNATLNLIAQWTKGDYPLTVNFEDENSNPITDKNIVNFSIVLLGENDISIGAISGTDNQFTLNKDNSYKITVITGAGYRLDGFTIIPEDGAIVNQNENNFIIANIAKATTITIIIKANSYEVTANPNSGTFDDANLNGWSLSNGVATKTIVYANEYNLPTITRLGYSFLGWFIGEAKLGENPVVLTASDHTIEAKWQANTYEGTIDYDNDKIIVKRVDGQNEYDITDGKIIATTGEPIVLRVTAKEHYENVQVIATDAIVVQNSEDTTTYTITGFTEAFTITINADAKKYKISLDTIVVSGDAVLVDTENTSTLLASETEFVEISGLLNIEYLKGFTYTANKATGYEFSGWYDSVTVVDGKVTEYGQKISEDTTFIGIVNNDYKLYAVFKLLEFEVKVKVDGGHGTFTYGSVEGQSEVTEKIQLDSTVVITPVAARGYEFKEWIVDGTILTESNSEKGISLAADGTITLIGKTDIELQVRFAPSKSEFDLDTELTINGIIIDSSASGCSTVKVGTLDALGNFVADDTIPAFMSGKVPFVTDRDVYLQIEVAYGYSFNGLINIGTSETDPIIVASDYNPDAVIEGSGLSQKTIYVRKIKNLNAANTYGTLRVKIEAVAVSLMVNFISDNVEVDAGRIFVDDERFGVVTSGNAGSKVTIQAMITEEIDVTAFTRFNYTIVESDCYKLTKTATITNTLRETISDRRKGFTTSFKFTVSNYVMGSVISIKVIPEVYNVELYDGTTKIGETITNVKAGDRLNTSNHIEAISELANSRKGYELKGFYTAENGCGELYIDGQGICGKNWEETGFFWNGTDYEISPNYNSETNSIKLYAGWARWKSAITLYTAPKALRELAPTVAATLVITSLNSSNSWTTVNNIFFADMLYGADIRIEAPVYDNYVFSYWTIMLDGIKQEPIYDAVYLKEGGFNCRVVDIYANYNTKVILEAGNGGNAKLIAGDIIIEAGKEGYIPTNIPFILEATPDEGYIFEGWFNSFTGELISSEARYEYPASEENEIGAMSIEARFIGKPVQISVGDYDKTYGYIQKIYLNGELKTQGDELEAIDAKMGDIVDLYVCLSTVKKYGVKWNSDHISYYSRENIDKVNQVCYIYRYIVSVEDVKDNKIVLIPTITEELITIKLDVRLNENTDYSLAGEVITEELVNDIISISYGDQLDIIVKVNDYYRIKSVQLDNRSISEYLAGEVLTIPSSVLNSLGTELHTLKIEFGEQLWIESNNLPSSLKGDGTEKNPYIIATAEDLAFVAYEINIEKDQAYANSRYILVNDISLIGKFWVPIGTDDCKYNSVFNFNGFKVYGLTLASGIDEKNTVFNGVFYELGQRAEIILNNNALTIVAISVSVSIAVIMIGVTVYLVVRRRRKRHMEELSNN